MLKARTTADKPDPIGYTRVKHHYLNHSTNGIFSAMKATVTPCRKDTSDDSVQFTIARPSFFLDKRFLLPYSISQPEWGPVGYLTYKRTYARTLENGRSEEFWQTLERVVNGTFSIQKNHCSERHLPWDEEKSQKSAQKMFRFMWEFKFLPPGRGLWAMGTEHVQKAGGAALNNPLSIETPILTKEFGWIRIGDIETDEVTVLTSVKRYGSDAEMLSSNSVASASTWAKASVTPTDLQFCMKITVTDKNDQVTSITASNNHRWHKRRTTKTDWERVTTEDLRIGDFLPIVKPTSQYKPSVTGYQHGFFFGDGTRSNGELHQFTDSIPVLEELFGNQVQEVADTLREHKVVRQCPLAWGELPEGLYAKDSRYAFSFLAGYFAADGSVDKHGTCTLHSARLEELEQIVKMAMQLGIRVSDPFVAIKGGTDNNLVKDRNPLYAIKFDPVDLRPDFFLKEAHRSRWEENTGERRRDWARITSIENAGEQEVRCVEVPGYEQFVVDGFVLTSNCAFVSTKDVDVDLAHPFLFLMDMSMLGVGVGFDTRGAGKCQVLPNLPSDIGTQTYVVPDTREGWVTALQLLLEAYTLRGHATPRYDFSLIRPAGAVIKGFGGIASGPIPLKEMLEDIEAILQEFVGTTLPSSALVDIGNLVGRCVVAGNVRRTAEIIFGDPNDIEFSLLKQDKEKLKHHRWASNNSIFAEVGMDYGRHAAATIVNGEPGYMWMNNARKYGRMRDEPNFKDEEALGGNPCLEQTLHNYELCTLVETFPARHDTIEEYMETLKIAYLYAKTVTLVPTHWGPTNVVINKNRRIGLSQSGIIRSIGKHGFRTHMEWCDAGYRFVKSLDTQYSNWLGIPRSIKTTSVKPSGTVSLLCGEPPGIHYPHSEFYIRRIRLSKNSPLLAPITEAGYHVEPEFGKESTSVCVSVPVREQNYTKGKVDASVWEQVSNAAAMQRNWADNQVSCTVSFQPHEADDIERILEMFEDKLKGISFLPLNDHGYVQAPYETIDEATYLEMASVIREIKFDQAAAESAPKGCDGDSCEVT